VRLEAVKMLVAVEIHLRSSLWLVLVLAEMHLNPDEVGLAATEMMVTAEMNLNLQNYTWPVRRSAYEILVPAEMHPRPKEMRLVAAEMLVPAEMHLRPKEVLVAASEMLGSCRYAPEALGGAAGGC
jgi:hypothetical protein